MKINININKINEILQENQIPIKIVPATTIKEIAGMDNFSATFKPGQAPIKIKMNISK